MSATYRPYHRGHAKPFHFGRGLLRAEDGAAARAPDRRAGPDRRACRRGFPALSLEQVHATLIALDGVRDPQTGAVVNAYLLAHAGLRREMDLPRVMDILAGATPLRVRIGGFRPGQEIPFTSRGQHLAE